MPPKRDYQRFRVLQWCIDETAAEHDRDDFRTILPGMILHGINPFAADVGYSEIFELFGKFLVSIGKVSSFVIPYAFVSKNLHNFHITFLGKNL